MLSLREPNAAFIAAIRSDEARSTGVTGRESGIASESAHTDLSQQSSPRRFGDDAGHLSGHRASGRQPTGFARARLAISDNIRRSPAICSISASIIPNSCVRTSPARPLRISPMSPRSNGHISWC